MVYLRILCVLAAYLCCAVCRKRDIQISFTTLKSDLDMVLELARTPTIVNIEYTEAAVLHLVVAPNPHAQQGLCIKFEETLNIKLTDGTIIEESDVVYANGLLRLQHRPNQDSFPFNQNTLTSIIIKPDKSVKTAHFTISYTSMKELTKDLQDEARDIRTGKFYKDTGHAWPHFSIGSSSTPMSFSSEEESFFLRKPLKGISLREEEVLERLFDKWHTEPLVSPSSVGSSSSSSSGSSSSGGVSPYGSRRLPDVFFDVWYDPKKRRYGSSSGSLSGVDAVRIYGDDEWKKEIEKKISALQTEMPGRKGEHIRRRALAQDLDIAYRRLNSKEPFYDNFIIDYAGEIILEVRPGADGDHQYVTAKGISVGARGGKPNNVRAFYDLEKLEYSDQVATNEKFNLETKERSSFFKYVDWETFESHMEGIWTAMQGGCNQPEKRVYLFRIFYGDEINVRYDCDTKSLKVIDTLLVLTDIPKTSVREDILKAAVSKCTSVLYLSRGMLDSQCVSSGITPIAIQLEPDKLWFRKSTQVRVNAQVFKKEVEVLGAILTNKGKSDRGTLVGTVVLDDIMLFGMKLETTGNFKIHGNFLQKTASGYKQHEKLEFNGAEFKTPSGVPIAVNNVYTAGRYEASVFDFDEFIIASDYLTIKKLMIYLRKVLYEALKRCSPNRHSLRFKLVRHRKFALDGFCDCSKRVILVEGKFGSLLINEMDGYAEACSTTLINDFIYVDNGGLLIPGTGTVILNDAYAISVPEFKNYEATRKEFGGPIVFDRYSFVLLKFEEDTSQ